MTFSIVIFAHSENDFNHCKNQFLASTNQQHEQGTYDEIFYCDSKKNSRLNFIKAHPNKWLLFLDSDCEISEKTLQLIKSLQINNHKVLGGRYLNPMLASYLQKGHNFIANTWLTSSYRSENKNKKLLGGAFLIYTDPWKINKITEPKKLFWGAEDKLLSEQLLEVGFDLKFLDSFEVIHHTSKELKHFFKRAWLQGYNDHFAEVKPNEKEKLEIKYWLSELARTGLWLAPAILVHFLILQSGKLFQKIRP